jgi:hypothetical protein
MPLSAGTLRQLEITTVPLPLSEMPRVMKIDAITNATIPDDAMASLTMMEYLQSRTM